MSVKWTPEQTRAIEERGKNILVSAAAGSGKTAVLVERIRKLITEERVPVDQMLIVTFTNAAAAEMREKIRRALAKELAAGEGDQAFLRKQMQLLPNAYISTFHAFAQRVIRRFFYLIDQEPGFTICDPSRTTLLEQDAMDQLLEEEFGRMDEDFRQFLDWYSGGRDEKAIRTLLQDAYTKLMAMPHPWQWLEAQVEDMAASQEAFLASPLGKKMTEQIAETLDQAETWLDRASSLLAEEGLMAMAEKMVAQELSPVQEAQEHLAAGDLEECRQAILQMPTVQLRAGKADKDAWETVQDRVKPWREEGKALLKGLRDKGLLSMDLAQMVADRQICQGPARTLQRLLLRYDAIFREAKATGKWLTFSDLEHLALEILEQKEGADYYREHFQYLFIDEYQDTNVMQETILDQICREDNRFMVGDVKQSIYRFRLADPELFVQRYEAYSKEEGNGMTIDLNLNFRSKGPIVDGINEIFALRMDGYDARAMLYDGQGYTGPYAYAPEILVTELSGDALAEEPEEADGDEEAETLATLQSAEVEAAMALRIIRDNLGKPFYDAKEGQVRPMGLRDMVILLRSTKSRGPVYYETFRKHGIDCFVQENDGYLDTMEIALMMDLLSVIDNRRQDVPLLGVLHSEIFAFSAADLAEIRAHRRKGSFLDALLTYAQEGPKEALQQRCQQALAEMDQWRSLSRLMPLGRFLWKLLLDTGYYLLMGAMPDGAQRQANLQALVDWAERFSEDRQSSLYGFIRYMEAVQKRKVAMGQVRLVGEGDELVRIMTIHKSKGLEFPLVIVGGMGSKLNYTKGGTGFFLDKEMGLAPTRVAPRENWHRKTLPQILLQNETHRREIEEEIRVLYVALTRARDRLYMTGTVRSLEKWQAQRDTGIVRYGTYLEMLVDVPRVKGQRIDGRLAALLRGEAEEISPAAEAELDAAEAVYMGTLSEEEAQAIRDLLRQPYPYEAQRHLRSKYSVSELQRGERQPVITLREPNFAKGEMSLTAAQKGTLYHTIMEHLDFVQAARGEAESLERQVAKMVALGIVSQEERDAIDLSGIQRFFASSLGQRCAEAAAGGNLEKEKPFTLAVEEGGESYLVQGIIDCCFTEGEKQVLIDYKTGYLDTTKPWEEEAERLRETYGEQIRLYAQALGQASGKPVEERYIYLAQTGQVVTL